MNRLIKTGSSEKTIDQLDDYLKLKSFLKLYPERTKELWDYFLQIENVNSAFRNMVGALVKVGTEEAQELLTKLMAHYNDEPKKLRIIVRQSSFIKNPNPQIVEQLIHIAESSENEKVAKNSELALGAVGHKLIHSSVKKDQERGQQLESRFTLKLKKSSSENERFFLISALGNMGASSNVDLIEQFRDQPQFLNQSLHALRLVPTKKAEDILVNFLHNKKTGTRRQASLSLTYRQVSKEALSSLVDKLYQEQDTNTLMNLAKAIASHANESNNYKQDLKAYALNCWDPDLFKYIQGLISTI